MLGRAGANVIKLFLSVNYRFSYKARVFVRLDMKKLTNDKHSSLLRKSAIYVQKRFITLGPGGTKIIKLFMNVRIS
jgi:hypothetical protein